MFDKMTQKILGKIYNYANKLISWQVIVSFNYLSHVDEEEAQIGTHIIYG